MANENLEKMTKNKLLPICSVCRAVRIKIGKSEEWLYSNEIEEKGELYNQLIKEYGKKEGKTNFTHTYCPICVKEAIKEQGLEDY